jgi:hypothetical protein
VFYSKAFQEPLSYLKVLFFESAPETHSRVSNINCNIGEGEGSHYYFQEKFPTTNFFPN